MRIVQFLFFIAISVNAFTQSNTATKIYSHGKEYHVSEKGNDASDGSISKPFKPFQRPPVWPCLAMDHCPCMSLSQQIPAMAHQKRSNCLPGSKGEKVEIKGSEIIKQKNTE
jgi:hypothetical protein